ncbi:hypothetical protein PoB_006689800 [Plakobranchus ocellatus]|uniref:Uncharacterized protein n=1 Tax=Plakobranchus ocellatus TaxID=259542 RepID=A0AAV4D833_9GAST|nr:hypothetical protein PoB_006689800 [Plakobranchus ocellatus]
MVEYTFITKLSSPNMGEMPKLIFVYGASVVFNNTETASQLDNWPPKVLPRWLADYTRRFTLPKQRYASTEGEASALAWEHEQTKISLKTVPTR